MRGGIMVFAQEVVNRIYTKLEVAKSFYSQHLTLRSTSPQEWLLLHELFHVLGAYHEHQRQDRDNFLEFDLKNPQCALFAQRNVDDKVRPPSPVVTTQEYDFMSISHYTLYHLCKTVKVTTQSALYYQRYHPEYERLLGMKLDFYQFYSLVGTVPQLSSMDIHLVKQMYPFKRTQATGQHVALSAVAPMGTLS
jgi:hypothetical protein